MAERRMFAKTVVDNDGFLDMPASAQLLYFHLAMSADDDGFANKPKAVMRSCGSAEADMQLLFKNGLIIPFESGVTAITHWKLHNIIRKDMYTETKYLAEKRQLSLNEIGAYILKKTAEPLQPSRSDFDEPLQPNRSNFDEPLRKDRIGKDRIEQVRTEEDKSAQASAAAQTVVKGLNAAAGTHYCTGAKQTVSLVKKLLESGHTEAEMLQVISMACEKWKGTEKETLLRPSFLFGEHFEELLGGDISAPASKQKKTSAHSYDARPNTDYNHVYTDFSELANLEEI